MSAFASPESVCRMASDTEFAHRQIRRQWHSPGEVHFEVAFVGAGTCTITAQGNGATYQTVKAGVSINVITSQQRRRTSSGVRAALLKDARLQARGLKDLHPYDIRAVLTTEAAAAQVTGHKGPGGEAYVYLVAMRGNFKLACVLGPARGAVAAHYCGRGPGYPVMMMTVLASDDEVERKDYPESYPELNSLGAPFPLTSRGQH